MLTKFEVSNFKNFAEKITLDLTDTNHYAFNTECLKNGIVNKGLIYGHNGAGKSNLGFAIFDLIFHLTDKNTNSKTYSNYLNAFNTPDANGLISRAARNQGKDFNNLAAFSYEFNMKYGHVKYSYGKTNNSTIVYEKLEINGIVYAKIDRRESTIATINAAGAENLTRDIGESKISILAYISNNTILADNKENLSFSLFMSFVDSMLFFRSLENNDYIGLEQGSANIDTDIIENGNLENFQYFLNEAGINCKLDAIETVDGIGIAFKFKNKLIPFFEIASQGTRSLTLFYFWLQRLKKQDTVAFLFIDEFDAFYHHSLSALIIKELNKISAQTIVTTHNTSIMTNELLRPDCYFLLKPDGIESLANSTVKELREGHNIEKMYRAGSFNG